MRGIVYWHRKKRLLAMALVLTVFYFFGFQDSHWARQFAEDKVTEFIGHRLAVQIGSLNGGIFTDMTLQNVAFSSGKAGKGKVFRLERMEISYRIWDVIMEKLGLTSGEDSALKYMGIYFSKENPFVQGFIKLYRYPEKIELFGHVSPILFGGKDKKGIKGVFLKREDGKYDCDLLWDGRVNITGTLDPSGRAIKLGCVPLSEKKGIVKISASIDEKGDLQAYFRLDKADLFGTEVIGDLRLSYRDEVMPLFLFRAENMVVNKQPFWDFMAGGGFSSAEKVIFLENVRWGEGISLAGKIGTDSPYFAGLKLFIKNVDLGELAGMLGDAKTPLAGKAEGEINFDGPIKTARVKGRLYIGEGMLDDMEFRSMFATLEGKLPVIKVVDSRVVKEGGLIIVSGHMDFSKLQDDKAFEDLVFETDNKVAVWEDWQISKEEKSGVVEARKDRMTLSTTIEDGSLQDKMDEEDPVQKELGFKYKIDTSNSLKLKLEEENDFLGLEHKIQF
jgi:hypothetical protein